MTKYKIIEVDGDGSCFFNSIATLMYYEKHRKLPKKQDVKKMSKLLRRVVVESLKTKLYMKNNNVVNELSVSLNDISNNSSNTNNKMNRSWAYVKKMSLQSTWAGALEIKLLADFLHGLGYKGISVYDRNTFKKINLMSSVVKSRYPKSLLRIVLSDIQHGGLHFEPMIKH